MLSREGRVTEPAPAAAVGSAIEGGVLVTGAGLIGSLTARAVEQAGGRAMLLDIAPQEAAIRSLGFRGDILKADVADGGALTLIVRQSGVRSIVQTAVVQSRTLWEHPLLAVSVNIGGALNALEAARACALDRVILAGSSTVMYASFELARSLGLPSLPEDMPSALVSGRQPTLYAAAKAAVEQFAAIYADRFGIDAVVLRYAAVLGHWDGPLALPSEAVRALVVPALRDKPACLADPLLTWAGIEEFVDARDCAAAALRALQAPQPSQVVFNIAYPEPVTHGNLVDAVRRRFPHLVVRNGCGHERGFAGYPAPRPAMSDVTAAERLLDFRAQRTLQDSVDWIIEVER